MSALGIAVRVLIASPFLVSGVIKAANFPGTMAEVRGLTGLEPAWLFATFVIVTQLGGSAMLFMSGRRAALGAGWLAAFTAVATLVAHSFWTMSGAARVANMNAFFEHVSIIGGLLLCALVSLHRARA